VIVSLIEGMLFADTRIKIREVTMIG